MTNLCSCCENGCIADPNILLRKYRDDMVFYLFVLNYNDYKSQEIDDADIDQKIEEWINNKMEGLYKGEVLKKIQNNEKAKIFVKKYKLKDSFEEMANYLNNYVHSNGYKYYNEYLIATKRSNCTKIMKVSRKILNI